MTDAIKYKNEISANIARCFIDEVMYVFKETNEIMPGFKPCIISLKKAIVQLCNNQSADGFVKIKFTNGEENTLVIVNKEYVYQRYISKLMMGTN